MLQCSHDIAVVENYLDLTGCEWVPTLQCSHDIAVVEN